MQKSNNCFCLLDILTSVRVLRTPNADHNLVFSQFLACFCKILMQTLEFLSLFPNPGRHNLVSASRLTLCCGNKLKNAQFFPILHFCCIKILQKHVKNMKKADFNQRLECALPNLWLKYATHLHSNN